MKPPRTEPKHPFDAFLGTERVTGPVLPVRDEVCTSCVGAGYEYPGDLRRCLTLSAFVPLRVGDRPFGCRAHVLKPTEYVGVNDVPVVLANRKAQTAGSVNGYHCPVCSGVTYTVHRDAGVTPFLYVCLRTPGCGGLAQSTFYPRSVPARAPLYVEWQRSINADDLQAVLATYPSKEQREWLANHHAKGGCLDHRLTATPPLTVQQWRDAHPELGPW